VAGTHAIETEDLRKSYGDDVWISVAWCLGPIAVFSSLAVARYRRVVAS
jgi:hypothetical protein